MSRLTCNGTAGPVSRDAIWKIIFLVQLTIETTSTTGVATLPSIDPHCISDIIQKK